MATKKKQNRASATSTPPASSPPAAMTADSPPSVCKRCQSTEILSRRFLRKMDHSGMHYVWNVLKCKCGQLRPERIATPI
jgi:hypothetical protein